MCGLAGLGWSPEHCFTISPGDSDAQSDIKSTELAQFIHFTDEKTAAYGHYKACPGDIIRTRTQNS